MKKKKKKKKKKEKRSQAVNVTSIIILEKSQSTERIIDCFAVSVFFVLFSLQASVTVKIRGGAISNDLMVVPSHFGCRLLRSLCFLCALLIAGLCHCQNSWWRYIK